MKNLFLLLLALLLASSTATAKVPGRTHSLGHYQRQQRKAVQHRRVSPHKVRHAYNR